MKLSIRTLIPLGALTALFFSPVRAVTIDFGVNLEAGDTYLGTSFTAGNLGNTEADIASIINGFTGTTTFTFDQVFKTDKLDIIPIGTGVNDQFAVPAGWNWLLVKYDGPNGGVALFSLAGNDALLPYDSAPLWGTGDEFGVSHYAVAGPVGTGVPDGGSSAALLGLGLVSLGYIARRKNA